MERRKQSFVFAALQRAFRRRRINLEENGKVVAAVWGKEFFQLLATLAIVH